MLQQIKNTVSTLSHTVKLLVGPKTNLYEFVAETLSVYSEDEHETLGLVDGTYKNMALYEGYYDLFVRHNMSKVDICVFLKLINTDQPKAISPFEARMRPTIDYATYLLARYK